MPALAYVKSCIWLILIILNSISLADDQNVSEILEKIQRDIKTLEKAVYSSSLELNNNQTISNSNLNANTFDWNIALNYKFRSSFKKI